MKTLIITSFSAFTQPRAFSQALPMLSSKISLIPLVILTLINAAWVLGIASRTEYVLNSQQESVLNLSSDPTNSLIFALLVIILIFLSLTLVVGVEAALLQVITQLTLNSTPTTALPAKFKSFFILTSHAHVPYLIETTTLGIILNGMMISLNFKIIINLDSGKTLLETPITKAAGELFPILSSIFVIGLLLALTISSYLIYLILFKNNQEVTRMTILKVLLPFNLVKMLLVIIAPIPMLF